jgi:putative PIN family toxin of toxin-antitoxin system
VRIAFDTNVLVSAVATRGLCADLLRAVLTEHQLVVGITVLAELRRTLRQKFRVPLETVDELDALLRHQAVVVEGAPALSVSLPDKADAAVLAEAFAGGAEVLVTGDRDLLDIAAKSQFPILSPRQFWERLRAQRGSDGR